MFNFFKKSDKAEFSLESFAEQCIPYACHYDDHNLLTKNGELIQVIKIEGYSKEMINIEEELDLRAIIRKAILDNVKDQKVAIWFHTMRRKRNLDPINYYSWTFAQDTHDSWSEKNHWRDKFVNELYITILYDSDNYDMQKSFLLSLFPKMLKSRHLKRLEEKSKILNETILKMLNTLKVFGGKRLKVVHDRFGVHSEILEFLTKIICLQSRRIALPIQGIDSVFHQSKIAFGGSALEIFNGTDKHYAAMLSLKEYHEFSSKALDKFLRISTEYVISQTLNFVDSKEAKKSFEYLDYILGVSKDEALRTHCGLKATVEDDQGNSTDYGNQQMTIMIIGESLDDLQRSVSSVMKETRKLGIVAVREDLHISLCFWSQLPGNFNFFRRTSYINTRRTAGFASLHNTPSGETENIWGSAVTLFRRADGAPHFFNLHTNKNGNTIIAGPSDSAKGVLANFLISESSKYDPNIFYIDQHESSIITVKALGGSHKTIDLEGDKPKLSLNPFSIPNSPENSIFLKNWLLLLIFPDGKYSDKKQDIIFNAIDKLLASTSKIKQISMLMDLIEDKEIKEKLSIWCKPNKLGLLFDNSHDELGQGSKVLGINIAKLLEGENKITVTPFVLYCMYKYTSMLDNTPTIVTINDASSLLNNKVFTDILPGWLDTLKDNNAIAILVCDTSNEISSNITSIKDEIATYLFLPNQAPDSYEKYFQITKEEVKQIKDMKLIYRHFMIKQNLMNIVVELNLDGMDYAIKALSGKRDAIEIMEEAIAEKGDNPNSWIISFYKKLFPDLH